MKKKSDKERLFEVMGRLDKTFKHPLNEISNKPSGPPMSDLSEKWGEEDLEFEKYPGEFKEAEEKLRSLMNTSEFWDKLEWVDVDTILLPMDDHIYVFKFYEKTKSDEVQDYYDYKFGEVYLGRKDNMSKYHHNKPNNIVELINGKELPQDFVEELENFNREKIAEKN